MANSDNPSGLTPVSHISGAPWNGATLRCYIDAAEASGAIYIGDAVDLAGAADTDGTCLTITKATAGNTNPILGVITFFEPDTTNPSSCTLYREALTARYCQVCVDPDVVFEVQGDSVAVVAATSVGSNADLIFTHTGNTITGISGMELNSSAINTGAAYQLKILGAVPREDNDISLVNAKWRVMINLHRLRAAGVNTIGAALAGPVGV